MHLRPGLLAVAAFAALADAAIVVLALPAMLVALHTTVVGVASVVGLYTAGVAVTVAVLAHVRRRRRMPARLGAWACWLFGAGALACAVSPSLVPLIAGRLAQSIGGGAIMLIAFDELRRERLGVTLWGAIALIALAAGPALGGVLTELLGWRSIFAVQVPIAIAAGAALTVVAPAPEPVIERRVVVDDRGSRRVAGAALVAVSGALTGVLFLLILLLVAGWATSPLTAAAAVTVLPFAAVVGGTLPGRPARAALLGSLLVAAGTAPLAFLPDAHLGWVIAPQILAGLGMGFAMRGLAGGLLAERTTDDAARLLVLRHVGMTLVLAALAPVVAGQLRSAVDEAKLQGAALVLNAEIDPMKKVELAPQLVATVEDEQPRRALTRAEETTLDSVAPAERAEVRRVASRADDVLVRAVGSAFRWAFVIAAGFALVAALLLAVRFGGRTLVAGGAAVVLALTAAQAYAQHRWQPEQVALQDPCTAPDPPSASGTAGRVQRVSLQVVDKAACHFGASREELVLALANARDAERFEERHGVNPRSVGGFLRGFFGG